jgi:hypothetical protein
LGNEDCNETVKLLPFLLLLLLPAVVQAQGIFPPTTQFYYTTNNGTITITACNYYDGNSFFFATNRNVTIPSNINGLPVTGVGVYGIGGHFFIFFCNPTNITIPGSVTNIAVQSLNNGNLASITVDESNPTYRSVAGVLFDKSKTILMQYPPGKPGDYTVSDSVTNIVDWAFYNCISLTTVTIPDSIASIGDFAFENCTSLTSVTIGNGLTSIGHSVFFSCTSLTNVTIGSSLTSIGSWAFYSCKNLTGFTIGNSVNNIGVDAFAYTSLTNVVIPDSVVNIGDYAFADCASLMGVTFGNGITSIGDGVFVDCSSLPSITIPYSVTNIGDSAFGNCYNLTNITIPNNINSIGVLAFDNTSLVGVTISGSVTSIGSGAFADCTNLTNITVDGNNSVFSGTAGVLFDHDQTSLVQFPGGKAGSYEIPDSVTSIRAYAFRGCTGLTNVIIPFGVTNIADWAFGQCYNLNGVFFYGNAPISAGGYVFDSDYNATVFHLPSTTGWEDFANNTGIPVALWLPQAQTTGASFGVQTNHFGFNIQWASGQTVVVDASTNLINWQPVQTNTLTTGTAHFSDPQWTNYPGRFYRLRSP